MKLRKRRAMFVKVKDRYGGGYLRSFWGRPHCKKEDRDLECPNCAAYDFLETTGRFPYTWEEMDEKYRSNFDK